MRRSLVVLLTVLGLAVALAPAAGAATGQRYVALGDSYSSGVGAGDYIGSSGSCDRSPNAYSALWAASHAPASYTSVACSGAKTTDIVNSQVSALSAATTLVSLTIGGNDVGFSSIIETCVLQGTSACVSAVSAAENLARTSLPGLLSAAYNQISSHAPNARVVVLSYPVFYDLSVWFCIGLSSTSRAKIDEGINVVDGVISTAASAHHFRFADVRAAFAAGHQICDSGKWLHALNFSDLTESYHPTASGQSGGYLPAFTSAAG